MSLKPETQIHDHQLYTQVFKIPCQHWVWCNGQRMGDTVAWHWSNQLETGGTLLLLLESSSSWLPMTWSPHSLRQTEMIWTAYKQYIDSNMGGNNMDLLPEMCCCLAAQWDQDEECPCSYLETLTPDTKDIFSSEVEYWRDAKYWPCTTHCQHSGGLRRVAALFSASQSNCFLHAAGVVYQEMTDQWPKRENNINIICLYIYLSYCMANILLLESCSHHQGCEESREAFLQWDQDMVDCHWIQ